MCRQKCYHILRALRRDGSSPQQPIFCFFFRTVSATPFNRVSSRSTNEEGGDTTIPSPGRSPKQTLPGIGLHDPLHGRQACPEFNSFYQGVGQICPREGLFLCRPLPKRGNNCDIPAPSIVERLCRSEAILKTATRYMSYEILKIAVGRITSPSQAEILDRTHRSKQMHEPFEKRGHASPRVIAVQKLVQTTSSALYISLFEA